MREHDLDQLARRLGEREARVMDGERVAARVVARLASGERLPRPARFMRWGLAAAAVLTVATLTQIGGPGPAGTVTVATPVAVGGLDADALAEALDSLTLDAPPSEFVGFGLGSMTTDELQALLAAMEG